MATSIDELTDQILEQLRHIRKTADEMIATLERPGKHALATMKCAWCRVDEGRPHVFGCPLLALAEDR